MPEGLLLDSSFVLFMLAYIGVWVLMFAASVAIYVMQAISLNKIARRREIRHAWLAWLPIGWDWILGSVSDQYRYVVKGQVRSRRKILLGMDLLQLVCMPVWAVLWVLFFTEFFIYGTSQMLVPWVLAQIVVLPICIVRCVYWYICLYDLYHSCKPGTAVLFLILNILFNITLPILLLVVRNWDEGMPPRKDACQPEVQLNTEE